MPCTHSHVLSSGRCYFCNELVGPTCEWPSCTATGSAVPRQTMYEWDGKGEDPNRDLILCQPCGEEHTQIMTDQWNDYYGGRL